MIYCILSHVTSCSLILLLPDVVGLPLAGIIGSVVGGLLLVALFCLLIIYCIKQKQKNKVLTMEGVEI